MMSILDTLESNISTFLDMILSYHKAKFLREFRRVYCGPLRLLAHEIFDRFNSKDVLCNFVTGEKRRELKGLMCLWRLLLLKW
ncbi:hypothetical protein C2G38_2088590 [Gigaspora rosea]|uniref:ATP-dependent RNA helicase SUV3 DEXQ-box helicase domain-containing protein n=1 Tax=Gigaspora rosea TaxID=44941 RepID=A0A397V7J0_9GLOM|nr:hypothetical protein C2G38_2088590 [Gigaspora rosea]